MTPTGLPVVTVTRYVTPLREGGSLPGVVEGDDLGTYVCKFRGAGQGAKVLVAEVIVSELARRLGLRTPRLVVLDLDPELARYEADEEVQDLLNAERRDQPRRRLPARLVRLRRPGQRGRRRGRARCSGSTRSPPTSTGPGATPTCCSGTATSGSSTTAPRSTSTTAGAPGVTDPAKFAAPAVGRHRPRLRDLRRPGARAGRARSRPSLDRDVLRRGPRRRCPTCGSSRCPAHCRDLGPDALRAAYVDFLAARLGTRQWLPGVPR